MQIEKFFKLIIVGAEYFTIVPKTFTIVKVFQPTIVRASGNFPVVQAVPDLRSVLTIYLV